MHNAGHPVSPEDFQIQVLEGLRPEFESIEAVISARGVFPFDALHSRLVAFEDKLRRRDNQASGSVVTANNAQRGISESDDALAMAVARHQQVTPSLSGPAPSTQPNASRSNNNHNPRSNNYNKNRGHRGGYNNNNSRPPPTQNVQTAPTARPTCQICRKTGHETFDCWHRFEQSFTQPQANTTSTAQNGWLLDFGATNHITNNLNNLTMASDYTGTDSLIIDNGKGFKIAQVGNATLNSLSLPNTLYVPSKHTNLISVAKLCRDNDVLVEFHSTFCLVKAGEWEQFCYGV